MAKPNHLIMSPPDYFDIEYSINPWMNLDNKVDPVRAKVEWQALKSTYTNLGLQVDLIPPVKGLPDLVFTTDHGKWIGNTFYLSNFRYSERQKEQTITIPWYQKQKIKTLQVPSPCLMEGGDVLVEYGYVFVGYGFRTSIETVEYLSGTTRLPTIALELVNQNFYHLDTCFLPISPDTAFYYPPAFSASSLKALKSHFDLLLPLSSHEAEGFACNSVIIGKTVLCQPNPTFEQQLNDLGLTPLTLEMHEFNKSGGGIHCLSQLITTD